MSQVSTMKIIYLHQYFRTPNMSGGTRSYEMARRLVAAGHEVHMVTSWTEDTNHSRWFEENIEGIHVYWYPNSYNNKMSFSKRIKAFVKFAKAASVKVSSFKDADIIFATSTPLTIAIPAIVASKLLKLPMVFEVRDLWPEVPIALGALKKPYEKFLARKLEEFAYKNSSHIVALSPGMKEGIKSTGYPENQISVIPNSSDNELFAVEESEYLNFLKRNDWLPSGKVLIYTGTLGIVNGLKNAVDIAIELKQRESDISIVLIGDGIEYDDVNDYALKSDVLNKNFFMRKSVPKTDIPFFLKYATIASSFVIDIPELRANSANKFFDALAASRPILINYGGWQKDIIEENDCGVIAWKKTNKEIVDELEAFLNDEQKYIRACNNAKGLALDEFSRDNLAKKLENIILQVGAK